MFSKVKQSPFFVFRKPALPLNALFDWQGDRAALREQLIFWLDNPAVQEALYLASPSLMKRLQVWREEPNSKKGKKLELVVAKYFIRMTSRATPFGLFASVGKGHFTGEMGLNIQANASLKRKTRLDMNFLFTLRRHLITTQWNEKSLRLIGNPSLYKIGEEYRYIESYLNKSVLHYRLASLESSPYLDITVQHCRNGGITTTLIDELCKLENDITVDDATDFIQTLIDNEVIQADLPLKVTGGSPDSELADSLEEAGFIDEMRQLTPVLDRLKILDGRNVNMPSDYSELLTKLKRLPVDVEENRLFQVDAFCSETDLSISKQFQERFLKDLKLCAKLIPASVNPLQGVVNQFAARFEGRLVPIKTFLDDESGWSMSTEKGTQTPLLKGLRIHSSEAGSRTFQQSHFDMLLADVLSQRESIFQDEVMLTEEKIEQYKDRSAVKLPASWAAIASLYEDKQGNVLSLLHNTYGPSSANLLGRFCHLDENLQRDVVTLLKEEEATNPDCIFAEIIHLPEGRTGNVIARPILRCFEIPFITSAAVQQKYQIDLDDLYVYVEDNEVRLWSKRLSKSVIPRLSSAHNYSIRSLGIYKFLCSLQHQNYGLPRFEWGAQFSGERYLPRIRIGNTIIAKRRWLIERKTLLDIQKKNNAEKTDALAQLTEKFNLPQWLSYAESDNRLIIQLSNPIMLDILLSETRQYTDIVLHEVLESEYSSVMKSEGASFAHEIIIPFSSNSKRQDTEPTETREKQHVHPTRHMIGGEWLSIKIYAGNTTAERLLCEEVASLFETIKTDGYSEKAYYLRYSDPDWHLRIRVKGPSEALLTSVLPRLNQLLNPKIQSGVIKNVTLDTYDPETERYGGSHGIELAESIFDVNSAFCLSVINKIDELGEDSRWMFALRGIDSILNAFSLGLEQKKALVSQLREHFGREYNDNVVLRKSLGTKHRENQQNIVDSMEGVGIFNKFNALIERHTSEIAIYAIQYRELDDQKQLTRSLSDVISALLHMFNNRLFTAYGRQQEFVCYDMLKRYYDYKLRSGR